MATLPIMAVERHTRKPDGEGLTATRGSEVENKKSPVLAGDITRSTAINRDPILSQGVAMDDLTVSQLRLRREDLFEDLENPLSLSKEQWSEMTVEVFEIYGILAELETVEVA